MRLAPALFCLVAATAAAQSDRVWKLTQASLTYHMSHPVHEVDGTSHSAVGKGVCHAGTCDFLIAVPVKTFDSGDTNRDLHMLQVTRGAAFPLVTVRVRIPEDHLTQSNIDCDLEVNFSGNTAHYEHVPFQQSVNGEDHRITGTIPATVSDFKITPPSFLMMPIKNEIPIKVDMTWR